MEPDYGQQFDDELEEAAGSSKAADAGSGRHPRGKFAGRVSDVIQKDWQGQPIWEIHVATDHGTTKSSIWGWKPGEVAAAKAQMQSGSAEAWQKIQQKLARYKRLFVDLGLPEPEGWAKGENSILGRLGELKGRPCSVVVQPNRKKPDEDMVFINAPQAGEADSAIQQSPEDGLAAPDFGAPSAGLDSVPF